MHIGEVVEHVLNKKGEWGYLVIPGLDRKEYRYGELLDGNFAENMLGTEVEKITAHGGWSNMDYRIELASMSDKEVSDNMNKLSEYVNKFSAQLEGKVFPETSHILVIAIENAEDGRNADIRVIKMGCAKDIVAGMMSAAKGDLALREMLDIIELSWAGVKKDILGEGIEYEAEA